MNHIFFVVGVNGVGKTTTLNLLKNQLPMSSFSLYDFDEKGVPDNAGKDWRRSETGYWLSLGIENKKLNKKFKIASASAPFFKQITARVPFLSDSSLISAIPFSNSLCFSFKLEMF